MDFEQKCSGCCAPVPKIDIDTTLKKIKTLLTQSRDTGQILNLFSSLTKCFAPKDPKLTMNAMVELFNAIEPKLKWQKDLRKNQGKRDFYADMATVYLRCKKPKTAVKCYKTAIKTYFKTFQDDKNVIQFHDIIEGLFYDCWGLASQYDIEETFIGMFDLAIACYNPDKPPKKYSDLYFHAMNNKSNYLRTTGETAEAVKIGKIYLNAIVSTQDMTDVRMKINALRAMINIAIDYHNLDKYEKSLNACDKIIQHYRQHYHCGSPMTKDLLVFLHYALYYKTQNLALLQSCKAFEAFHEYSHFMQCNRRNLHLCMDESKSLGRVYAEESLRNLLESMDTYFDRMREANYYIDVAKGLIKAKQFRQAIHLVNEIIDHKMPGPVGSRYLEVAYMKAQCQCPLGLHEFAIERVLEMYLPHLDKEPVSKRYSDIDESYFFVANCYLYHCHYPEEALNAVKAGLKYSKSKKKENKELTLKYMELLVYFNKFNKFFAVLARKKKKYDCKRIEAIASYLKNDHRLALEAIKEFKGKKDNLLQLIEVCCWRQIGKSTEAMVELMTNVFPKPGEQSANLMLIWLAGLLEVDQEYDCQDKLKRLLESLFLNSAFEVFVSMIANSCFQSLSTSDPKKLLSFIQTCIKSKTGSTRLKKHQKELFQLINSIHLSLFVQKKLRLNKPFCIFSN